MASYTTSTGELTRKPHECVGCPCYNMGRDFTQIEIGARYESTRIMLVGEASGASEAQEDLPFRPWGQAGSLLSDCMREVNLSRADVAITNCLRCRPKNDWLEGAPYAYTALNKCVNSNLKAAIDQLKPKVIVAVGGTAMRWVCQIPKGKYGNLDYARGFVYPGGGVAAGILTIPTYHTAHLRRGTPELTPLVQKDLRRALLLATGKLIEGQHYALTVESYSPQYQPRPTLSEALEWENQIDPSLPIVYDIETKMSSKTDEENRTSHEESTIVLVQFTQHRKRGIALPWRDEYIEIIKRVLALPNDKIGHNSFAFDNPVLEANGVEIKGELHDTMTIYGFYYSDLPRNLQAAAQMCGFQMPWKAMADDDLETYGCFDVDATLCVYQHMRALLEREGMWDSYRRYFAQLWPILRDMSRRGIPIDEAKRAELKSLIVKEDARVTAAVQGLIPAEVLITKQKNGYKRPPILQCPDCEWKGRTDHECSISGDDSPDSAGIDGGGSDNQPSHNVSYAELAEANGLVQREVTLGEEEKCLCSKKSRAACPVCCGSGLVPAGTVEVRWAAPVAFNPNSANQVKRYFRFKKYPIPRHAKRVDVNGEASETTEFKELQRLFVKTKDPVIPLLIEKRQLTKTETTYHDGWAPWPDGRVRTTFGFGTATWQSASKNPNVQNGMKHWKTEFQKELVEKFNAMQRAPEGYCLVNFDFKSFHGLTAAYEFNLPDYARLARIDIHSFITCQFLRIPECKGLWERDDSDMKGLFKSLRKDEKFSACRDVPAKQTILGIQLGRGPKSIYTMYQEYFDSLSQAQAIWNLVYSLFPGLRKGQQKEIDEAFENKRIVSKFGGIRHFWDVKRFDRKQQKWVHGDQAEQAMAFRIQNNAFGHYRIFLLALRELGLDEKYALINQVHDSALFLSPLALREECIANVRPLMERPSDILVYPKMGAFHVDAEAMWGESMADLH